MLSKGHKLKTKGHIGFSPKKKNSVVSNVCGAAAYNGQLNLLRSLYGMYGSELGTEYKCEEKKGTSGGGSLQKELSGATPLMLAVASGDKNIETVKWMIEEVECNTKEKDWQDNTVLHLAVRYNCKEIVSYLICANLVDPFQKNQAGESAVSMAQALGLDEVSKILSLCKDNSGQKMAELLDLIKAEEERKEKKKKKKADKRKKKHKVSEEEPEPEKDDEIVEIGDSSAAAKGEKTEGNEEEKKALIAAPENDEDEPEPVSKPANDLEILPPKVIPEPETEEFFYEEPKHGHVTRDHRRERAKAAERSDNKNEHPESVESGTGSRSRGYGTVNRYSRRGHYGYRGSRAYVARQRGNFGGTSREVTAPAVAEAAAIQETPAAPPQPPQKPEVTETAATQPAAAVPEAKSAEVVPEPKESEPAKAEPEPQPEKTELEKVEAEKPEPEAEPVPEPAAESVTEVVSPPKVDEPVAAPEAEKALDPAEELTAMIKSELLSSPEKTEAGAAKQDKNVQTDAVVIASSVEDLERDNEMANNLASEFAVRFLLGSSTKHNKNG